MSDIDITDLRIQIDFVDGELIVKLYYYSGSEMIVIDSDCVRMA